MAMLGKMTAEEAVSGRHIRSAKLKYSLVSLRKKQAMARQMLMYESVVPLNSKLHADTCIEPTNNYEFTSGTNAVPLMAVEIPQAAGEFAIVFSVNEQEVIPVVILGIQNEQNLFLGENGQWKSQYIPAFIRRYPFVFAAAEDKKTLTLCVDEKHAGVNAEGRGQRLFEDEKPTEFTQNVLKFLENYQKEYERTKVLGKHLQEHDLLEPTQVEVAFPSGSKFKLAGFHVVSREKMKKLTGETLSAMVASNELELIYMHLNSLRNLEHVKNQLEGFIEGSEGASETAADSSEQPAEES